MTELLDLDFYGGVLHKMTYEGLDYYVIQYESESKFDGDPDLKVAFVEARTALNRLVNLVHNRIEDTGGNPEDYEA